MNESIIAILAVGFFLMLLAIPEIIKIYFPKTKKKRRT